MHWYVDESHQIHEDCCGQSGSLVTFGQGAVASSSNKMKCNTKSSTETELIRFVNKLADIIWMRYFIECQGYNIDEYDDFQDYMSALLLENNGRVSSSKCTEWCGAHVGGPKYYALNLILRLFLYHFLHAMSS